MADLASVLLDAVTPPADPVRLSYGTVTVAAPLTVQVGASTLGLPCRRLDAYAAPVVGDYVAVLVVGADRLCLGKVVV